MGACALCHGMSCSSTRQGTSPYPFVPFPFCPFPALSLPPKADISRLVSDLREGPAIEARGHASEALLRIIQHLPTSGEEVRPPAPSTYVELVVAWRPIFSHWPPSAPRSLRPPSQVLAIVHDADVLGAALGALSRLASPPTASTPPDAPARDPGAWMGCYLLARALFERFPRCRAGAGRSLTSSGLPPASTLVDAIISDGELLLPLRLATLHAYDAESPAGGCALLAAAAPLLLRRLMPLVGAGPVRGSSGSPSPEADREPLCTAATSLLGAMAAWGEADSRAVLLGAGGGGPLVPSLARVLACPGHPPLRRAAAVYLLEALWGSEPDRLPDPRRDAATVTVTRSSPCGLALLGTDAARVALSSLFYAVATGGVPPNAADDVLVPLTRALRKATRRERGMRDPYLAQAARAVAVDVLALHPPPERQADAAIAGADVRIRAIARGVLATAAEAPARAQPSPDLYYDDPQEPGREALQAASSGSLGGISGVSLEGSLACYLEQGQGVGAGGGTLSSPPPPPAENRDGRSRILGRTASSEMGPEPGAPPSCVSSASSFSFPVASPSPHARPGLEAAFSRSVPGDHGLEGGAGEVGGEGEGEGHCEGDDVSPGALLLPAWWTSARRGSLAASPCSSPSLRALEGLGHPPTGQVPVQQADPGGSRGGGGSAGSSGRGVSTRCCAAAEGAEDDWAPVDPREALKEGTWSASASPGAEEGSLTGSSPGSVSRASCTWTPRSGRAGDGLAPNCNRSGVGGWGGGEGEAAAEEFTPRTAAALMMAAGRRSIEAASLHRSDSSASVASLTSASPSSGPRRRSAEMQGPSLGDAPRCTCLPRGGAPGVGAPSSTSAAGQVGSPSSRWASSSRPSAPLPARLPSAEVSRQSPSTAAGGPISAAKFSQLCVQLKKSVTDRVSGAAAAAATQ